MTRHQKILIYVIGLLVSYLFIWPVGFLALFFFADMDHQFPTRKT